MLIMEVIIRQKGTKDSVYIIKNCEESIFKQNRL